MPIRTSIPQPIITSNINNTCIPLFSFTVSSTASFTFSGLVFSIFSAGAVVTLAASEELSVFSEVCLFEKSSVTAVSCTAAVGRNLSTISFVSCFFSAFNVSPDVVFETDTFGVSGFRFAASFLTESLSLGTVVGSGVIVGVGIGVVVGFGEGSGACVGVCVGSGSGSGVTVG